MCPRIEILARGPDDSAMARKRKKKYRKPREDGVESTFRHDRQRVNLSDLIIRKTVVVVLWAGLGPEPNRSQKGRKESSFFLPTLFSGRWISHSRTCVSRTRGRESEICLKNSWYKADYMLSGGLKQETVMLRFFNRGIRLAVLVFWLTFPWGIQDVIGIGVQRLIS